MWIGVRQRFARFNLDLIPTKAQIEDALGKAKGIGQDLQRAYGGQATDNPPVFAVGSWGKLTQVRPSADIDVMAKFDWSTYERFNAYASNGQSALLQEVKGKLQIPHPQTVMRGDNQVVVVAFNTITVEVVPVFPLDNGQFVMPHAEAGGYWKTVDPQAQIDLIEIMDSNYAGNVRSLCRMIKRWKHEHSVDLKSFLIELMVVEFFTRYEFGKYDFYWYDFYVRDCLRFMRSRVNGMISIPGTGEVVHLGNAWASKLDTAIGIAERACDYEYADMTVEAGLEWQKIFGNRIPIHVL